MLAACAMGLGTCVIGFAVSALNSSEWKAELKIPDKMSAVVPIILGVPASATPPVPRKPPEFLSGHNPGGKGDAGPREQKATRI
jgi:hypothetical protein